MFLRKRIDTISLLLKRVRQLFLPSRCIICGSIANLHENLCSVCYKNLPSLSHQCQQCATFLSVNQPALLCGNCLTSPPPFDQIYTLFPYEKPIPELIMQLKFQHQLTHAKLFSDLFVTMIQHHWYQEKPLPQLIMPVPLHPKRLAERGFNQSVEIIRDVAKKLNISLDLDGIKRIKHTEPQRKLLAEKRSLNVKNAFYAVRNYENLSIAVVDDVITTGHTIRALCEVLRAEKAAKIDVWCCARR